MILHGREVEIQVDDIKPFVNVMEASNGLTGLICENAKYVDSPKQFCKRIKWENLYYTSL